MITPSSPNTKLSKKPNLYHKPIWNHSSFFYNYNSIFYGIKSMISIFQVLATVNTNIISYAAVFVNDCIFNISSGTYSKQRNSYFTGIGNIFKRFIIIIAH